MQGCPAPEGRGGPFFMQRKSRLPHPACGVGLLPARTTFAWSLFTCCHVRVFWWFLLGVSWSEGVRAPRGPMLRVSIAVLTTCVPSGPGVLSSGWLFVPCAGGCRVMNMEWSTVYWGSWGGFYMFELAVLVAKGEERGAKRS